MGQKITYDALDPKKGMSLAELQEATAKAAGLAKVNEKELDDCKVSLLINWSGGIKQITMEV
jgi:hypothetical protein